MKIKNLLVLIEMLSLTACAQIKPSAQITFKVLDESGKTLPHIPVGITVLDHSNPGIQAPTYKAMEFSTDERGLVVIKTSNLTPDLSYWVRNAPGYYTGGGLYTFRNAANGQWQPWNPTVELVLRPIISPVRMYAREIETRIQKPAQKYGYDLLVRDWVAPVGTGQVNDLFFELTGYANNVKDYNSTLIVSFTNSSDGIQPFVPIEGSAFRSPREAPLEGYQDRLELRRVRTPGDQSPDWVDDTAKKANYFFRVRTVLDESGKIKSALYGKIYGGFNFFGASTNGSFLTISTCYLNPEPNSRNMEFDPGKNLFKKLPSLQQVTAP